MTPDDLKALIDNARATGKLPRGMSPLDFYEMEYLYYNWLNNKPASTVVTNAAKFLKRYSIPLKSTGIGWKLVLNGGSKNEKIHCKN